MDDLVIYQKLSSLKRCVDRIRSKIPETSKELQYNYDLQDIISVNLQRAVQLCVDIGARILTRLDLNPPLTMADIFECLKEAGVLSPHICMRMKKSIGFRNIAVHEYHAINWDIVYSISTHDLKDFQEFAAEIVAWLENN
jgi:uncharacterized protein YutE (UPF0331/DUF86 family)